MTSRSLPPGPAGSPTQPREPGDGPRTEKQILIVAGEASGDLHGAALVQAMQARDARLRFFGAGGNGMAAAGVSCLCNAADLAVVGVTEALRKVRTVLRLRRQLRASLDRGETDLAILIDYPDFNIPLARAAHKAGVPVLYYISPQVWAWRRGRIRQLRRWVDHMAVILPFEERLYVQAGLRATFVGHPLLDRTPPRKSPAEARRALGLREDRNTVALLPGSRPGELANLLSPMLGAARALSQQAGPLQFVLPLAEALPEERATRPLREAGVEALVVRGQVYEALQAANLALVASGTATLQAALMETPMVIIYKVSRPSYYIGRLLIRGVSHIGLVNIVAGRTVVPELIQNDVTPDRIAAEALPALTNEEHGRRIREELRRIRALLGTPGAAGRTAEIALGFLGSPS